MAELTRKCLENNILRDGTILSKYSVDDTKVIFIQEADGKIDPEAIWIKIPDRFADMFWLITKGDNYPTSIEVHVDKFNCNADEIHRAIHQMEYIQNLCEEIMGIFNYGTHKELYDIHHKEV